MDKSRNKNNRNENTERTQLNPKLLKSVPGVIERQNNGDASHIVKLSMQPSGSILIENINEKTQKILDSDENKKKEHVERMQHAKEKYNEDHRVFEEEKKQARYSANKEKIEHVKEKISDQFHNVKKHSKGLAIAAAILAGIGATTLTIDKFSQYYQNQQTISTDSASVLRNNEREMETAHLGNNQYAVDNIISEANKINKIQKDGSYKNMSQDELNDLAEESHDACKLVLASKMINYYNSDKESDEQIPISEWNNVKVKVIDSKYDSPKISVYIPGEYGNNQNLFMYEPDGNNDAVKEYAELTIAMNNGNVTYSDIKEAVSSTTKAASETFAEHGLWDKTVSLEDSVVSHKEIQNYKEQQKQYEEEKVYDDESSITDRIEKAEDNPLGISYIETDEISLDDYESTPLEPQEQQKQDKDYDDR